MTERVLRAVLPMPPSGNSIQKLTTRRLRGKVVPMMHFSEEAKRYRERVKAHMLAEHVTDVSVLDTTLAYELKLVLYLEALNKGWPGKAKTRFKDLDTSNRVLLLENCIKQATGMDDYHHFRLVVEKKQVWEGQEESVEVTLTPLPEGWWDQ